MRISSLPGDGSRPSRRWPAEPPADDAAGMLLESLLRDAALSVRLLRGSPSYAAAAILTYALGLATTATFAAAGNHFDAATL